VAFLREKLQNVFAEVNIDRSLRNLYFSSFNETSCYGRDNECRSCKLQSTGKFSLFMYFHADSDLFYFSASKICVQSVSRNGKKTETQVIQH
jgi:hypothetical protein